MGKYDPLRYYLENSASAIKEITLSFSQIKQIINSNLPKSAKEYRAWWANEKSGNHVEAMAWLDAGWKVSEVDQEREYVTFSRIR